MKERQENTFKSKKLVVILKGFPRVDEIFIAQELVELERCGFELQLFSLVKPEPELLQSIHEQLKATPCYVPSTQKELIAQFWSSLLSRPLITLETWLAYRAQATSGAKTKKRFLQALWIDAQINSDFDGAIYSHFANVPAEVALGVALMGRRKWFVFAHAKDIYQQSREILRRRLAPADQVFTCNRENLNYLQQAPAIHPRVKLIYHGLIPAHFHPSMPAARQAPHYISMGRLVEKKGHLFLVSVLERLKNEGQEFTCTIYGDGPLRPEIERALQAAKLADCVKIYGAYKLEEISRQIAAGDIYLGTFGQGADGDRDGLPNTLLEAMYMQCLIVSTYSPAISEAITDQVNGLLLRQSVPEWVQTLKLLSTEKVLEMSNMGKQTVVQRFLFKDCVEELIDILSHD